MYFKLIVSLLFSLIMLSGCADSGKPLADKEIKDSPVSDVERGRYVIELLGCNDCHTPGYMVTRANIPEEDWLVGGSLGFRGPHGTTYPTNLRLLLNNMPEEDWLILAKKMRKDSPMTWVMLPDTSEQELRAIYRFVKHLGPKGKPTLPRLPADVTPSTPYVEYPDPH